MCPSFNSSNPSFQAKICSQKILGTESSRVVLCGPSFCGSIVFMKTEVDVFQFKAGVDYLKTVYSSMRESNPRFSRRAFAAKLGMDQSMLTRYFGGVRLLASERVEEVAKRLELGRLEAQYFKVISLLGDRGELDILEMLRRSFLTEKRMAALLPEKNLVQSGALEDTELDIFNHVIRIQKEDRPRIEKALQDLEDLLAAVRAQNGDDLLVISTVKFKTRS